MKNAFTMVALLLGVLQPAVAYQLKVCTDKNFWYPFTYVSEGKSTGLHVYLAKKAFTNLGHRYTFKPMDWAECLDQAKQGKVDAIVSASYKPERAEYLFYPVDAPEAQRSEYRISQVEFVVVTNANNAYEFDGELLALPKPVRAPKDYSIVDDLTQEGVRVTTARSDIVNLKQLLDSKQGTVVTLPEIAMRLGQGGAFKGQLKVHAMPIKSKSYFLVVSKRSALRSEDRVEIWRELARVREFEEIKGDYFSMLEDSQNSRNKKMTVY